MLQGCVDFIPSVCLLRGLTMVRMTHFYCGGRNVMNGLVKSSNSRAGAAIKMLIVNSVRKLGCSAASIVLVSNGFARNV